MTEEQRLQLLLPFSCKDIQWRVSHTTKDKAKGFAIPYVDKRAIQNLLDTVLGAGNWKDEIMTVMGQTAKEAAYICKISIYFPEKNEWVSKSDGAGSTDYQPVKGGLSDAFKRAASMWGISRYLYDFEGVWAAVNEKKLIIQSEYPKLDAAYSKFAVAYLKTLPLTPQQFQEAEVRLKPASVPKLAENNQQPVKQAPALYQIQAAQRSQNATYLQIMDQSGRKYNAVVPKQVSLQPGQVITNLSATQQTDAQNQPYTLIQHYDMAA